MVSPAGGSGSSLASSAVRVISSGGGSIVRTVGEARAAALSDPTRWRACVYEATGTPVTERDDTRVYLFCLKKTAEEKFRERIAELVAAGYARDKRFRLGAGLVKLDSEQGSVWLAIDKR